MRRGSRRPVLAARLLAPPLLPLGLAALGWWMAGGLLTVTAASPLAPLLPGDRLLVERRAYRHHLPRRGDLVVVGGALGRVVALPGETLRGTTGGLSLDGRALPRWRVADRPCPGDPACPRRRDAALFPDGRVLVLPRLPAGKRHVAPGALLLLDGAGRVVSVPAARVAGRAGPVLASLTGRARWDRPATWAGAFRWERFGRPLEDGGGIGYGGE